MISTAITAGASRVASGLLCLHAVAITPAGSMELVRSFISTVSGLSLCNSQVGSCTCSFAACSAFTHVTACTLAESPSDSLHRKLRQLRCLHCRFDCYRVERTSSRAGVAPAEVQRLSRRTVTSTTGEPLSFRIATIHELAWLAHTRAFVDTDLQCHLLDQKTKDSQYAVTCSSIAGASRRS